MKFKNILLLGAAAALCACEPLEDSNWVGNSLAFLDWKSVTGNEVRPEGVTQMTLHYIPQNTGNRLYEYEMPAEHGAFDVQSGCYDVIALSGGFDVSGLTLFETATVTIPSETSPSGELLVTRDPGMLYLGVVANTACDYLHRTDLPIVMERALKRINFVVHIGDKQELTETCRLELAGMASRLNLSTLSPQGTQEVVHVFDLHKEGRHWNEEGKLTTYKGHIHCLGILGKNILEFRFTDADGKPRDVRTDISAYLANWNTDEVTLRFTVNVNELDTTVKLDGFELGNTTDIEF